MDNSMHQLCTRVLDELDSIEVLKNDREICRQLQYYRERAEDAVFRIAVVGEFSSGKSTFINALLGRDVLNHALTETTATITQIINTQNDDPRCGTGCVKLRDGSELHLHSIDDLRDYTTTTSKKYAVVEDIESVTLYMPLMDAVRPIVVVDTPGLNGTADGHRAKTIELIRKSHACLYLLQRRGLTESDVDFLRTLKSIQKNYIFIQNFIDDLRENDDVESFISAQERILKERVYDEADHVEYCVCGISAWLALVGRDESIQSVYEDEDEIISRDKRKQLYQQSRFDEFYALLADRFNDQRLDMIQYGDTLLSLCDWLHELAGMIEIRELSAREAYKNSGDSIGIKRMKELRQRIIERQGHEKEQLQALVRSEMERIRKNGMQQVEADCESALKGVQNRAALIHTLHEMDALIGDVPGILRNQILQLSTAHHERIQQRIHILWQTLLKRIQKYSFSQDTPELEELKLREANFDMPDLNLQTQSDLDRMRAQKTRWDQKMEEENRKLLTINRQYSDSVRDVQDQQRYLSDAESVRESRHRRQGKRPAPVERSHTVTKYEYRGGLGILDSLFGPRKSNVEESYMDDSRGAAWDARRAEIENEYASKKAKFSRDLSAAQRRKRRLEQEARDERAEIERINRRVQSIQEQIQELEKTQEMELIHAKKEVLAKQKKELLAQVQHYLLDGDNSVVIQIEDATASRLEDAAVNLSAQAIRVYERAIRSRLECIDQAISERTPELLHEAEELSRLRSRVGELSAMLQACYREAHD